MTTIWTDNRPALRAAPTPAPEAASRTIPFDYSFHFPLAGVSGRTSRKTVSVSIEAAFTAVSIGYGLVPLIETFEFGPEVNVVGAPAALALAATAAASPGATATATVPTPALATATTVTTPGSIPALLSASSTNVPTPGAAMTLGSIGPSSLLPGAGPSGGPVSNPAALSLRNIRFDHILDALERQVAGSSRVSRDEPALETALRAGIRINPRFVRAALLGNGSSRLEPSSLAELFQIVLPPPQEVPFLYALFDEGSGREFQSEPVLSIAGLGGPDGRRPFRHFAHPITFAPRATIRMDVTELGDVRGDLYVSLHGYKVLGASGAGSAAGARRGARRRRR